jgi:hypothetical protein
MSAPFLYVFIVLLVIFFVIGMIDQSNKKEAEERDRSTFNPNDAAWSAERWSRKTDVSEDSHKAYREQGVEMYRYLREKGLTHSEANAKIELEYERGYDRARRKAIRDMTKQPGRKRRS